jgi:hypothetical protein
VQLQRIGAGVTSRLSKQAAASLDSLGMKAEPAMARARRPARKILQGAAWGALCLLLPFLFAAASSEAAAPAAASEYEVKAAFLFQFSRFVEWPPEAFASADAPLVICVLGKNPFGSTLREIAQGESVQAHALVVKSHDRVEDVGECHIVFLSSSEEAITQQVLTSLAGKRILTVGDSDDFTRRGGVIGFVTVNGKVKLQVNRSSAETAQLRISAKLLRVAEQVS